MATGARPDEPRGPALIDTIFALSSGLPPAAIAIVRISGPAADSALLTLAGRLPVPRKAVLASLAYAGEPLDEGLVLRFPGPHSATGEDLVELHLHGGRAVVAGVLDALSAMPGLRAAQPGEFTRRAFEHGRIDLTEAEGLADLLGAETLSQRRAALALAGGALGRRIAGWRDQILDAAASIEAELDFSDEGDVPYADRPDLSGLIAELEAGLARPAAERLKDGVRVVIAGPPNAGKSTLFNALVGREAAITSSIAGTTRDLVEAPIALGGVPLVLVDTAGLRSAEDAIETIGVERAQRSIDSADLVIWLGEPNDTGDQRTILVNAKSDISPDGHTKGLAVSAITGVGLEALTELILDRARMLLPAEGEVSINRRHRVWLEAAKSHLEEVRVSKDPLIAAESLRQALHCFDAIVGRAGVEDMLDALFSRFCVGK